MATLVNAGFGVPVAADDEALQLGEVVVTGERVQESEKRAPSAFVAVSEVEERAAPIETATEVLGQTVGVQVQRFGGLGAFSTISIRGSNANQVPVFLDGVPLSTAQDPVANLGNLPLDGLARVETYRGTVPVGFGGGGIGGVVNLVTRPPGDAPRTELSLDYGSFATRKAVLTHTRKLGAATGFLAQASYLGSEGDFRYFDDNGTDANPHDDGTTTRINNRFDAVDGLLELTHDFAGKLSLDVVQEIFFKDQGVPGPGSAQLSDPSLRTLRSLSYVRLRQRDVRGAPVDADVRLFGSYNLQEFSDPNPEANFGTVQDTRNQTGLVGASTSGSWYAPLGQQISWFASLDFQEFDPHNDAGKPENGPNQRRISTGLAVQDEIRLVADRLSLVPTLRYTHLFDEFSGADVAGEPSGSPDSTGHDLWTPSIGAALRAMPWLTLRANIGRFQRAPSFSELFGNSGTVVGNPKLDPETAINRDIGFVSEWPAIRRLDAGRLEYAYFHNDVFDLISLDSVRPGQFKAFNIGDAHVTGHELALRAGAGGLFGLDLNYTHMDSENRSVDSPEGNQLPLRPNDELFVRPRLYEDWGSLYYELTYLSGNPTDRDNFVRVSGRTLHTFGISARPLPWLTARFEAVNVTDADVRDLGDFPLPGLSFFGGLRGVF